MREGWILWQSFQKRPLVQNQQLDVSWNVKEAREPKYQIKLKKHKQWKI